MFCLNLSFPSSKTTYKGQEAEKGYFNEWSRKNHFPRDFREGASFRMTYRTFVRRWGETEDTKITGSIVSVKNGCGAPDTLVHFDPGFELVIDAGDKGLFVLGVELNLRGKSLAKAKLGALSVCPRVQAALQRGNNCLT